MRCVIQRVSAACVVVDGTERASTGRGLCVLAGLYETDTDRDLAWSAEKIANIRIFEDAEGKMNLSVRDLCGGTGVPPVNGGTGTPPVIHSEATPTPGILLIPNFTLAGDARKGRRPSFDLAMKPERAGPMFDRFAELLRQHAAPVPVATGVFRADMKVALTNDGPVTIILDSSRAHIGT